MLRLLDQNAVFVGFKMDTSLRRQIEALTGPDRKYVSEEDSTFLRVCRIGDAQYIGKIIEERLTTDRVRDICRNVSSILQRLFPEERLPANLEIIACDREGPAVDERAEEKPPEEGSIW